MDLISSFFHQKAVEQLFDNIRPGGNRSQASGFSQCLCRLRVPAFHIFHRVFHSRQQGGLCKSGRRLRFSGIQAYLFYFQPCSLMAFRKILISQELFFLCPFLLLSIILCFSFVNLPPARTIYRSAAGCKFTGSPGQAGPCLQIDLLIDTGRIQHT